MSEQIQFRTTSQRCYVANPNPEFKPLKHYEDISHPHFSKKLINSASQRDVSRWEGFYMLPGYHHKTHEPLNRQRHFNKHRARAIRSLTQALCYHLNILTGTVPVSFTTLTVEAGLATESKTTGKLSITRGTRAAQDMAAWGLIHYRLVYDKVSRQYFPADIEVSELFFDFVGVSIEAYKKAQNQQLAFKNKNLLKKGETTITVTEARRREKERYQNTVWQRRKASQEIKKIQKAARTAVVKDAEILRHHVAKQIQHEMRQGLHQGIDIATFRHLVNKRIAYMRKVNTPDPGAG